MPVIGISVKQLNTLLGRTLSPETLVETLERLGCDLEGIAQNVFYSCPKCGVLAEKLENEEPASRCATCGYESETPFESAGQDQVIRLDLLPARPDLFDAGGLARAIKGYLEIETGLPEYAVLPPEIEVTVDARLAQEESYRPFIACAVVTMPEIDSVMLRTLMKLQESLHWGIGRDRKLSSIGVYDLSTITPPIRYTAVEPESMQFHALGKGDALMTPAQVLKDHPKGVAYAHLLEHLKAYPVLIDSKGQVLSMPPIINSDETKVKIGSTRLFIDVTGITPGDVQKALKTLVTSLIEMGGKAQAVTISDSKGKIVTPDLTPGRISINLPAAERWLGLKFTNEEAKNYLGRMRFSVKGDAPDYQLGYPAFRTDMKHEVDVFEDLAIAYGYHRMPLPLVQSMTIGKERPEEKIANVARSIMLGLGFDEIFSLVITTQENHFQKMRCEPGKDHAIILNPKTAEYNIVRAHLMSGLLEALTKNRIKPLPQRYFELGNIVLMDETNYNKAREERHLGFAVMGENMGYAYGRSIVDSAMRELGITGEYQALEHPSFIQGRAAKVALSNGLSGWIGEVHPEVLQNFSLTCPVVLGEIALARVV